MLSTTVQLLQSYARELFFDIATKNKQIQLVKAQIESFFMVPLQTRGSNPESSCLNDYSCQPASPGFSDQRKTQFVSSFFFAVCFLSFLIIIWFHIQNAARACSWSIWSPIYFQLYPSSCKLFHSSSSQMSLSLPLYMLKMMSAITDTHIFGMLKFFENNVWQAGATRRMHGHEPYMHSNYDRPIRCLQPICQ